MLTPKRHALLAALLLCACARQEGLEQRPLGHGTEALLGATRLSPMLESGALDRTDRHLLLTLKLSAGETTVLDARGVDFPLPRERAPDAESWRVLVEDKTGRVLYLAQLKAPEPLRGEFAGPDGKIEAVHVAPAAVSTVAVRLPLLKGATTVRVFGPGETASAPQGTNAPIAPGGAGSGAMVELGRTAYPTVGAR